MSYFQIGPNGCFVPLKLSSDHSTLADRSGKDLLSTSTRPGDSTPRGMVVRLVRLVDLHRWFSALSHSSEVWGYPKNAQIIHFKKGEPVWYQHKSSILFLRCLFFRNLHRIQVMIYDVSPYIHHLFFSQSCSEVTVSWENMGLPQWNIMNTWECYEYVYKLSNGMLFSWYNENTNYQWEWNETTMRTQNEWNMVERQWECDYQWVLMGISNYNVTIRQWEYSYHHMWEYR